MLDDFGLDVLGAAKRKMLLNVLDRYGVSSTVVTSQVEPYRRFSRLLEELAQARVDGTYLTALRRSDFSDIATFTTIAAPGEAIFSAVTGGGYSTLGGTSMAAPRVAAAFALLRQKDPTIALTTLIDALRSWAPPAYDFWSGITLYVAQLDRALATIPGGGGSRPERKEARRHAGDIRPTGLDCPKWQTGLRNAQSANPMPRQSQRLPAGINESQATPSSGRPTGALGVPRQEAAIRLRWRP